MDAARIPPLENRGDQLNAVPEVGARRRQQVVLPVNWLTRVGIAPENWEAVLRPSYGVNELSIEPS